MEAEQYQRVKEIFQSVLEAPEGERLRLLDEKCGSDISVRAGVEKLLDSYDSTYLKEPAVEGLAELIAEQGLRSGEAVGHYTIIRKIGSGGMGEVYLAEDGKLGRLVAIKLLPDIFTGDADRLDRFQMEARTASALNHPNILTVHEIGETGSTRYIATEWIDGETLRAKLNRGPIEVDEALDVAIQCASALAAAHEEGIIHRDIKPENIMVRRDGLVKVLDFGLAKLVEKKAGSVSQDAPTERFLKTAPGMIMGTVRYMSPEQTRGHLTDARTDIWSLGCVIYEMLSGKPPFAGENPADVIAEIVKSDPEPLNRLVPDLPESLNDTLSKSLSKSPDERYQTAADLLLDLKQLKRKLDLEDELQNSLGSSRNGSLRSAETENGPVKVTSSSKDLSTVSSAEYLIWGIKSHRLTTAAIVPFFIGLIAGTAFLVRKYWSENPNEAKLAYYNKIGMAAKALETSNFELARSLLDETIPQKDEPDLRSFEWGYLDRLYNDRSAAQPTVIVWEGWVSGVAFSPDGKLLAATRAATGRDDLVTLWDVASQRELRTFVGHTEWVTSVEFSPDGRRLLTSGWDKTAKLWDVETGAEIFSIKAGNGSISKPAFSREGAMISAFGDGAIRLWETATGKASSVIHKPAVGDMAFVYSPEERFFAIRDPDQTVRVIDAATGRKISSVKGHNGFVTDIRFSPDSRSLVTASFDGTAKLWEVNTGKELRTFKGHTDSVLKARFSPDGTMIATGSNDDTVKLWDAKNGFLIDTLRGHTGDIGDLSFSPDGRRLVSGGFDNRIRIWSVPQGPPPGVLKGHTMPVNAITFSNDSKMIASASEDGTAKIWDADAERERLSLDHDPTNVLSVAFSNDGKTVATGGPKSVKLWSTSNGRGGPNIPVPDRVTVLTFSPNDKLIAAGAIRNVELRDTASGSTVCTMEHQEDVWTVEFLNEPNKILTSGGNRVLTWDVQTCRTERAFEGEPGFNYYSVYSITGKPWAFV